MGKSKSDAQRCRCKSCGKTFQLHYTYEVSKPEVKERVLQMSNNGSEVADAVRVLKVGKSAMLRTIKKSRNRYQVNPAIFQCKRRKRLRVKDKTRRKRRILVVCRAQKPPALDLVFD